MKKSPHSEQTRQSSGRSSGTRMRRIGSFVDSNSFETNTAGEKFSSQVKPDAEDPIISRPFPAYQTTPRYRVERTSRRSIASHRFPETGNSPSPATATQTASGHLRLFPPKGAKSRDLPSMRSHGSDGASFLTQFSGLPRIGGRQSCTGTRRQKRSCFPRERSSMITTAAFRRLAARVPRASGPTVAETTTYRPVFPHS